jgi:hypothetical protein
MEAVDHFDDLGRGIQVRVCYYRFHSKDFGNCLCLWMKLVKVVIESRQGPGGITVEIVFRVLCR